MEFFPAFQWMYIVISDVCKCSEVLNNDRWSTQARRQAGRKIGSCRRTLSHREHVDAVPLLYHEKCRMTGTAVGAGFFGEQNLLFRPNSQRTVPRVRGLRAEWWWWSSPWPVGNLRSLRGHGTAPESLSGRTNQPSDRQTNGCGGNGGDSSRNKCSDVRLYL